MQFSDLRLVEPILRAVADQGYTTPTPIQQQAIPPVLEGRDVLGCAQTGTGKTGAFSLPVLHRLVMTADMAQSKQKRPKPEPRSRKKQHHRNTAARAGVPRALIICPTRELAAQISDSISNYGKYLPVRQVVIFGGVNQNRQTRALSRGVDVIIATPGRLLDLVNQGFIDLSKVNTLVLDEADRMLDMGFIHDIRKVIGLMPKKRQTMLFSATMPPAIRKLADSILYKPVTVEVAPVSSTVDTITQQVHMVRKPDKPALLQRLLQCDTMERTLVFSRTKHGADKLVKVLKRADIHAVAIHGNKTQNARTKALDAFKTGRVDVLIATDIASRGIDVDDVTHVINYDLPMEAETYVHRIGRTARAGASGIAISFCDVEEMGKLRSIEKLIKRKLDVVGGGPGARRRQREKERTLDIDKEWRRKPGSKPRKPKAGANGKPSKGKAKPSRGPRSNRSRSAGATAGPGQKRTRNPGKNKGKSARQATSGRTRNR